MEESTQTMKIVLEAFDDHFKACGNLMHLSYNLSYLYRKPGQSFDQYLTEVKLQAELCDFGAA